MLARTSSISCRGHLGGDKVVLGFLPIQPPLGEVPGGLAGFGAIAVAAVAGQVASLQGIVLGLVVLVAVDG